MTILTKPVKRELPLPLDRRQWLIELAPFGINFRAKRSRRCYPITWDSIFNRCMAITAERERRERIEKRKNRRML